MARRGALVAAAERARVARLGRPRLHSTRRARSPSRGRRCSSIVPAPGTTKDELDAALGTLRVDAASRNVDARGDRTRRSRPRPSARRREVPFSSRRRWSAVAVRRRLVRPRRAGAVPARRPRAAGRVRGGAGPPRRRARHHDADLEHAKPEDGPPPDLHPIGIVVIGEGLRPRRGRRSSTSCAQDVELRVLSGDAPETVPRSRARPACRRRARRSTGATCPTSPHALARRCSGPRSSVASRRRASASRRGAARRGPVRGDDRRRRQRRAGAEGGAARRSRRARGTQMARSVADLVLVRGRLRRRAGHGRRGAEGAAQPAARREAVRDQVRVRGLARPRRSGRRRSPTRCCRGTCRSSRRSRSASRLLPGARAERRRLPDRGLPARRRAVRDSGGNRRRPRGRSRATCSSTTCSTSSSKESRTVAPTVLLIVGLYLILALESTTARRGAWVGALCAALGGLYAVVLILPFGRHFYALEVPGPLSWLADHLRLRPRDLRPGPHGQPLHPGLGAAPLEPVLRRRLSC